MIVRYQYAVGVEELDQLDSACASLNDASAAVNARRNDRDTAIGSAFTAGVPIGAIAERCGLTVGRVSQILGHPHGGVGRPKAGG